MIRPLLVLVACYFLLNACTQKVVCPAYQSAFIYDKEELRKKFSYFKPDSTPKVLTASKNKYLIAEPVSYKKKERSLQTVAAKPLNPVVPDSLLMDDVMTAELDKAARSVIDSTYIVDVEPADSVAAEPSAYVISVDREVRVLKHNYRDSIQFNEATGKYELMYVAGVPVRPNYYVKEIGFNVEQDNYMWYLRDVLILPDVRLSKAEADAKASEKKDKKGIKGFFGNLFGKKKKKAGEEVAPVQKASGDEFDYDEYDDEARSDSAAVNSPPQPAKKKGLLSSFGKKDKPAKQKTKAETKKKQDETPPAKKEEDDDGF